MTSHRVLIVDDDKDISERYEFLFRTKGWCAEHALNAEKAIEIACKFSPELVLLDLALGFPGKNGLDILPRIMQINPEVCVIVFTGTGSIPSAVEAMHLGAWHMLEKKGQRFDELFSIVTAIQNRKIEFDRMRRNEVRNIEMQARINSTFNLANGIAHDVKNRVSHLSMLTSLLEAGETTPDQKILIESLRKSIRQLDHSVAQLYEFSKVRMMTFASTDLCDAIEKSIGRVSQRLAMTDNKQISFTFNRSEELMVSSNENLLSMAIENVLDNAVEAIGKAKGSIALTAIRKSGLAEISCVDDGPGFSFDALERADMPFYTTKGKANHGNGLTFTKEIVITCGGSFSFGNNSNCRGAWVKISLPLTSIDSSSLV